MVQERSGLFTSAPKSLKVALRAADCRIREATEKLEAMLPLDKEKRLSLIEEIFDSE